MVIGVVLLVGCVIIALILYFAFLSDFVDGTSTNITVEDDEEEGVEYFPVSMEGEEGERDVAWTVSVHLPSFKVIRNLYVPLGGGRATEIDMVLLHNSGIYVLEVKNYSGWIFGSEGQRYWTRAGYNGKNQFYSPLMQNRGHINSLQRFLGVDPFLCHSYIVFTGDCELKSLTFSTAFHKVVKRESLERYINEDVLNYGSVLTDDEVTRIYDALLPLSNPSIEMRKEQIRTYQAARSREASGTRCPLCGGNLTVRRNRSTGEPFWGCSNYPERRYTRRCSEPDRQRSGRDHC